MNKLRIVFFSTALLSIVLMAHQIQAMVFEPKPCSLISCTKENYGKWITEAELVGYENGYAVCHCPLEPPEATYKVMMHRKY